MNWVIPSEDVVVFEQFPHFVRRFICYRPEEVMATFIVDGNGVLDTENRSIYAINIRESSTDSYIDPLNCLVRIGTSPGAADIGTFRVREYPLSVAGEGTIWVNETAYADAPVQDGMYGTMIRDHRIWERRIRRIPVGEDGIDFIEFKDYDDAYASDNEGFIAPIANVTGDSQGSPVKHMGMLDVGQDYRTVRLSSAFSRATGEDTDLVITWSSIYPFEFEDGYGENDEEIVIRIPAGFTEMRLFVQTVGAGFAYQYIPLWAFTGTDDPLLITDFEVRKDSRKEGRDMDFFIRSQSLDLPEGALIGYFEISEFGGDESPNQTINEFLGWAVEDAVTFRMFKNIYTLNVGGHQTWLDKINIGAQTVYDPRTQDHPTANAARFIEMPNNTPDKMIHYFLRINTTALEVMNLFFSDYDVPIEGHTSEEGSVWSTIVGVSQRYFGIAACDSVGSLYLTRHFSYLEQEDRDLIEPVFHFNKKHWSDDDAPTFSKSNIKSTGLVDIYGSTYEVVFTPSYVDSSHIFHVWAPGIVMGTGSGKDSPPSIYLDSVDPELQLRKLGGHHYARKNNQRPDGSLILKGNYDFIEPAWGKPITITYQEDNARNIEFDHELFLVKSVDVQHRNSPPFKKVSLNIEQVTKGYPGIALEVEQRVDVEPIPIPEPDPFDPFGIPSGTKRIAVFSTDNTIRYTANFDNPSGLGGPDWYTSVLSDLPGWESGDELISGVRSASIASQGWIATSTRIYGLTNVPVPSAASEQYEFPYPWHANSWRVIQTERAHPTWVMAATWDHPNGQMKVASAINGSSWSEVDVGGVISSFVGQPVALWMSQHTPGVAMITAPDVGASLTDRGDIYLFHTSDYGATWTRGALVASDARPATLIYVPYEDVSSVYVGIPVFNGAGYDLKLMLVSGGVSSDVSPSYSGYDYGPGFGRGFAAHDSDASKMILMGETDSVDTTREGAVFKSTTGIGGLTNVIAPSSGGFGCRLDVYIGGDGEAVYMVGLSGCVLYSDDFLDTYDDRSGTGLGSGWLVNLFGWQA